MTWYEYSCILTGHILRNAHEWERTRSIVYMIYRANTTDKKPMSPDKFMPLATDKKEAKKTVTEQDRLELSKLALEMAAYIPK